VRLGRVIVVATDVELLICNELVDTRICGYKFPCQKDKIKILKSALKNY